MPIFFNKKNQIYPELNPTERIRKIVRDFIFQPLEKEGFKILRSGLSIKRTVGIFEQEIWFSKSKWNEGNETCAFTPHFSVTLKNYEKWHMSEYGKEPMNDILESHAANYVVGWSNDLFENHNYDLAADNNRRIVELLNKNISNYGLPFLDQFSNHRSSIDYLINSKRYYIAPKMIDICIMNKDIEMSYDILKWFRNYEQTRESEFQDSTLREMHLRELKLGLA